MYIYTYLYSLYDSGMKLKLLLYLIEVEYNNWVLSCPTVICIYTHVYVYITIVIIIIIIAIIILFIITFNIIIIIIITI